MSEVNPCLMLKLYQEPFHNPPAFLELFERQRGTSVTSPQQHIERRILASSEVAQVVFPDSSLPQVLSEIRDRFTSEGEFLSSLESCVASRIAGVSDTDIEIFYLMHRERFRRPESRTLRHILVTINETLEGNDRASARRRIDNVRARLLKSPRRFEELAMKYSECTTAMNGGMLGAVEKGQLYPELDRAAFAMRAGELSRVVESPMGFHVVNCVSIESESEQPLSLVREEIRTYLLESRRRSAQRERIASLFSKVA